MLKLDSILREARVLRPPRGEGPPPVSPEVWERAVGSRIARRARPVRLARGTLEVRVVSATWANELSWLTEDIRRQLSEAGVAVERLRFVVGRVDPPHRRPRPRRRAASEEASLPEALEAPMKDVDDPDLREALRAAAARTLQVRR